MRAWPLVILLAASPAVAAPGATLTADLGAGTEKIAIDASGALTIGMQTLQLGAVVRPRLSAAVARGVPTVVVATADTAIIVEKTGGAWKERAREPIGGVGADADYGVDIAAMPYGLVRFQTRQGYRRCDGKPALLFAELWDGAKFRRLSALPTDVADSAPVIAAHPDPAAAPAPIVYQARVASTQPGATDAGALSIPTELTDGSAATAWHEELANSDGTGQFFTFEPRAATAKAAQLRIVAGAGNRLHRVAIVSSSGAWHVELPDSKEPLVADLPAPVAGCVTAVIESTYGPPKGTTAIAELAVYAEGERTGGGEAALAKVVAAGSDGLLGAEQELARRGAAGVSAIEGELAHAADDAARGRLVHALLTIHDAAAGAPLARAVAQGWVDHADMPAAIAALGTLGQSAELHDLAASDHVDVSLRIAAVHALASAPPQLVEMAGVGPRELRHATILELSSLPVATLVPAAQAQANAPAAGDLWRAVTRRARMTPDERAPALAALTAALPAAGDYERRYRIVDGLATLGDADALRTIARLLDGLPDGAERAALAQVTALAIATNPRPEALPTLVIFARDRDPGVRLAALGALATATGGPAGPWHAAEGPDEIDKVLQTSLLSDTWPEVRRRAAQTLGSRCQRPGPAKALGQSVARESDLPTRSDALAALVECKAVGVADLLAHVWDDGKLPVELRQHAIDLAAQLGDPQLAVRLVRKLDAWRGAALDSEEALALAQNAAYAVGRLAPPGAGDSLIAALDDSAYPEIVAAAATGLGLMGKACPAAARPRLRELAHSDERQVHTAAARAFALCGR
ncbi:MAG: HEAT repeat domain-containing protein [Deltaproteobacteria bacterium]|nr:HEAT repeat domain-containing protein [Deltaproteobacteria bacterium]